MFAAVLGLILTAAACRTERPTSQFIPDEAVAERALVSALNQWRSGKPIEAGDDGVGLLLVDARQRDGDALESFRLIGPQPWERGRRFVVELKLTKDEAPRRERFVVLGINPLLVFRQEDFDMLANWMHPMEPPDAAPPKPAENSSETPVTDEPTSQPDPPPTADQP